MCPFLTAFRRNISELLAKAEECTSDDITITKKAKEDLLVWWAAIKDCEKGLPIPGAPSALSLYHKTFAIHTATSPSSSENSFKATGLCCFGVNEDGFFLSSCSFLWDEAVIYSESACSSSRPINFMGMILCILTNIESLKNQHIVFVTKNISNCWDWEKQYSKGDETSNILIRCLAILSAFLGSKIHIDYQYRLSGWEGVSAYGLSRRNKFVSNETESVKLLDTLKLDSYILVWMKKPCADWSLPRKLAKSLI